MTNIVEDGPLGLHSQLDTALRLGHEAWSLTGGAAVSLDVVNHALRLAVQIGNAANHVAEFDALAAEQLDDGSWDDLVPGQKGSVRNTCFSARNLLRAGRFPGMPDYRAAVVAAARWVVARQHADGYWPDLRWGRGDATSSAMGFLHFVRSDVALVADEPDLAGQANACLERGVAWLVAEQSADGSWPHVTEGESPIEPTCHLLPKLCLATGGAGPHVAAAVDYLLRIQEPDGAWEGGRTDPTCDATRALMLADSVRPDPRIRGAIERSTQALMRARTPEGLWGEYAGRPFSLLETCDAIDTLSKFETYAAAHDVRRFWQ